MVIALPPCGLSPVETPPLWWLRIHLDFDLRLAILVLDGERPQLGVGLHCLVVEVAADQTLGIVHSVGRIEGSLGGEASV